MKKLSLLILIIIFSVPALMAQSGIIRGRILDESKLPMPGANIVLDNSDRGTVSDVNGFFILSGITPGKFLVQVTYIGYQPDSQMVTLAIGETRVLEFVLQPGIVLNGVEISVAASGQVKALNQQKNSMSISQVISSDQVGKFPDANVGDAIKRIPGINVQYDQGEARFGNIRGTAPQLNTFSINGERLPSAEAEIRSVQLDLIPADMVQMIEVSKAVTPDMDADAIGGAVNLVTRSVPSGMRLSGSLGSGYNMISGKPMATGALVVSNRFASNKIGIVAGLSIHDHQLGSDNFEPFWNYSDENDKDGTAFLEQMELRQYYVERLRQSYSLAVDYQINSNHKLIAQGMYNHRNDWENRYRLRIKDIEWDGAQYVAEVRRQMKGGSADENFARLEDQRVMNLSLGGEHVFSALKFTWSASTAKASEERPHERYLQFRVKDVTIVPDISDPRFPKFSISDPIEAADYSSEFGFHELTEQYQYTEDIDRNIRLDFDLPLLNTGKFINSLEFGARYRSKTKMRDNLFDEFSPIDESAIETNALAAAISQTRSGFMAGDYQVGSFTTAEFLGNLDLNDPTLFDKEAVLAEEAGDYTAKENILAGYLMINQKLGSRLQAIAGVRFERTGLEYQGNQYDADNDSLILSEVQNNSYLNVMPGLHLKYNLGKNDIIRFAYTNTLARPNYYDLVPYKEIYTDDNEILIGNPGLMATTARNLDLMYEHYFKTPGVLTIGVFHKQINDFIVKQTITDTLYDGITWDKFTQPLNAGNASLTGLELGFYRRLDMLPSFWKNLAVYGNYTFTTSQVEDVLLAGREDDISLPGMAAHTANASLAYEGKKLVLRASVNYSSAFLDEVGEEAFFDRYYDKATHLDVNAGYTLGKRMNIYLEVNNLLNQPLRYYQGTSERTMQAEYYGIRTQFGIKFNL
jgi:TonB-dependent receptor